jgi:hypothetical protein
MYNDDDDDNNNIIQYKIYIIPAGGDNVSRPADPRVAIHYVSVRAFKNVPPQK